VCIIFGSCLIIIVLNNMHDTLIHMGKLFFLTNKVLFFNFLRVGTYIIFRGSQYKGILSTYVLKYNLFVFKY